MVLSLGVINSVRM